MKKENNFGQDLSKIIKVLRTVNENSTSNKKANVSYIVITKKAYQTTKVLL